MRTQQAAPPPWPPQPDATAPARARLDWYAAVARWAPSKHNSQPWRFVVRDEELDVWGDPARILPDTDPQRRELALSCGAAVQLACVAARAAGRRPRVTLLPDGRGGPLARVVEVGPWKTTEQDRALLDAVPRRRTDRGPLDATPLPSALPFLLQDAAEAEGATLRLVTSPGDRATLARLVEQADRLLIRADRVDDELARWRYEPGMRRDGVPPANTRGPAASARAEFVQRDFSAPGSVAAQDRPGPDLPLVGVLCTSGDHPPDWLVAGQALASVLLTATVHGAAASYVNQPVEHPVTRLLLRDQLGLDGYAQMVLRVGVGGPVEAPPRRELDEVRSFG